MKLSDFKIIKTFPLIIKGKNYTRRYIAKCECGVEFKISNQSIRKRDTNKCRPCAIRKEYTPTRDDARLYNIWYSMNHRVNGKSKKDFICYKSKNIIVCEDWKTFDIFKSWALDNGYKDNLSIDRENNDGNYEPLNCRWANRGTQNSNTRKLRSNNTSGYRGVVWNNTNGTWRSRIGINKKYYEIGSFKSKLECAKAYDKYIDDNNLEHTKNFS